MNNFSISIQDTGITAFEGSQKCGTATQEKLEDFCKQNGITLPSIWDEQDQECVDIVEKYFAST